jgi:methylmalonyl-CoA/ethylmalonyl-CoA epimerase
MIQRISHIGVVVNDLETAQAFWSETYGLEKYAEYETAAEGIRACLLSVGGRKGEMSIELMEPLDKADMDNPVARRLARSGEGFYHLAVVVDDVDASGADLEAGGLPVLRRPPIDARSSGRWLVHPKASNGVLVEGVSAADLAPGEG